MFLKIQFLDLVFVFSFRGNFFPSLIRRWATSISVGVLPFGIYPFGFSRFISETFRFHHQRVFDSALNLFKLRRGFQSRIWDRGANSVTDKDCSTRRLRPGFTNRKRKEKMLRLIDYHQFLKRWHFMPFLWFLQNQWVLQYEYKVSLPDPSSILISPRRQGSDSSPTTFRIFLFVKLMSIAFWSFIRKMIASQKYMKGGHNRFHLLAYKSSGWKAWLLSAPSSKLFQFPVFAQTVVWRMFLYLVNS
uniref:Uncharacterized protein n=1 Tax=Noccaea caerulescens TaxID=107243 RepID=A0A1J3EPF3_NOCCA